MLRGNTGNCFEITLPSTPFELLVEAAQKGQSAATKKGDRSIIDEGVKTTKVVLERSISHRSEAMTDIFIRACDESYDHADDAEGMISFQ